MDRVHLPKGFGYQAGGSGEPWRELEQRNDRPLERYL